MVDGGGVDQQLFRKAEEQVADIVVREAAADVIGGGAAGDAEPVVALPTELEAGFDGVGSAGPGEGVEILILDRKLGIGPEVAGSEVVVVVEVDEGKATGALHVFGDATEPELGSGDAVDGGVGEEGVGAVVAGAKLVHDGRRNDPVPGDADGKVSIEGPALVAGAIGDTGEDGVAKDVLLEEADAAEQAVVIGGVIVLADIEFVGVFAAVALSAEVADDAPGGVAGAGQVGFGE